PRFARTAGPRPRVSPLARLQLEDGYYTVTSLRPSISRMESPITREMLRLLDGTRDHATLLNDLAERAAANPDCRPPDAPAQSPDWWREKLASQIEPGLAMAARNALLIEE